MSQTLHEEPTISLPDLFEFEVRRVDKDLLEEAFPVAGPGNQQMRQMFLVVADEIVDLGVVQVEGVSK